MHGRTVASGKDFTRYDECGGVWAEVLEEVGKAVEEDKSLRSSGASSEFVVREAHNNKGGGENDETHHLDGLATPRVDKEEGDPVSGNETGDGKN